MVPFGYKILIRLNTGLSVYLDHRGLDPHALRGLADPACPNIFPSPIFSSSFVRLCEIYVHIPAIDDYDSPVAVISIHGECSWALCNDIPLYSPGICTSALDKDATSSLDKTKHPR